MTFVANKNMITAAYVTEFHDAFEISTQQQESRLLKTANNRGKITGNVFTINDMGNLKMKPRTRFGTTTWDVPEAGVRRVYLSDKDLAVPIDPMDIPKMLANVQGPYMNACLYAYNREVDAVVYNALLSKIDRIDEYNGAVSQLALPNTQIITHGGTGLTKDKILFAKSLFRKNECDEHNGEQIYMTYDASMMVDILSDTTLTSADFMSIQMLQEGKIDTKWCGVNWIPYEALLTDNDTSPTYKRAAMYTGSAVHFGQGESYTVNIRPRPDMNETIQIYVMASIAAGRANEQKVVEIQVAA